MVIAVREDVGRGMYVGLRADTLLLECDKCTEDAAYRLLYRSDYRGNLEEHRFKAHQAILNEHPNHSDEIRIV